MPISLALSRNLIILFLEFLLMVLIQPVTMFKFLDSPTNLQNTRLTIRITFGSTTKLNKIWISWLAFAKVTTGFGVYGGQIARSGFSG